MAHAQCRSGKLEVTIDENHEMNLVSWIRRHIGELCNLGKALTVAEWYVSRPTQSPSLGFLTHGLIDKWMLSIYTDDVDLSGN